MRINSNAEILKRESRYQHASYRRFNLIPYRQSINRIRFLNTRDFVEKRYDVSVITLKRYKL